MKTLALALSMTALFATPAMAQQVVELPSLNSMIEQATNGGTIEQAQDRVRNNPPVMPAPAKKDRRAGREERQPEEQITGNQREAEAAAARAQKLAEKARDDKDSELIKQLKKMQKQMAKQRKYKPLKKVKFLPPNATSY